MTPPSRLRILMTADAVGGVWVYASALAGALCHSGHDVLLVTMGPPPRAEQFQPLRAIDGLHLKVSDLQLEWMDPEGADVQRASDVLLRIADEYQPHLVHLNGYREAEFDWSVPVLVVAHSCVRTWWRACRGGDPDEPRWRSYADHVEMGLSAADVWIAPTAAFRREIAETYGAPVGGKVIRNGLTFPPPDQQTKHPVIIAAGRVWDEAKNLKALASIAADLPWPVRIAGPERAPDGQAGRAIMPGVTALGDLSNSALRGELRRASIYVAPALYEPFGLTALEAAGCGCALVLSDVPGFRELWGGAALFVDPHDRAALRASVRSVCSDAKLRSRLQAAALERAQRYSLSAMASAYLQVYGDMVAPAVPVMQHRNEAELQP